MAEAVVDAHERGIDARVFYRPDSSNDTNLRELLSPDPHLRPLALALAEHEAEHDLVLVNLPTNLQRLLSHGTGEHPQPAVTVLRSGTASESEFGLAVVALAGSVQVETDVARSEDPLLALVRISGGVATGDAFQLPQHPHWPSVPGGSTVRRRIASTTSRWGEYPRSATLRAGRRVCGELTLVSGPPRFNARTISGQRGRRPIYFLGSRSRSRFDRPDWSAWHRPL